jgi:hypothetical protein
MAPLDGRSAAAQVEALDPFVRAEGGGGPSYRFAPNSRT